MNRCPSVRYSNRRLPLDQTLLSNIQLVLCSPYRQHQPNPTAVLPDSEPMCNEGPTLRSSKLGSGDNKRPSGEQQTAVAQSMTNAPAIVTTVAPVALPFIERLGGGRLAIVNLPHSNLGRGEQEEG
eukprot:superscaffoldBa00000734_g6872